MRKIFSILITTIIITYSNVSLDAQTPVPLGMEDVIWQKEGLYVWSLAFSPSQPIVAVGTDENIKIFNIADGSEVITLQTLKDDFILTLQFSPDGAFLYSGSKWGRLIKWNTTNWDSVVCIDGNNQDNVKSIGEIDISKDGKYIVLAGRSEGLFIYDISNSIIVKKWDKMPEIKDPKFPRQAAVNSVSFRYDGKVIAIGMKDVDETWLYDIETQQIIKKIRGENGQYSPTKNELIVKKIKGDLLDGLDYYKFDESEVLIHLDINEFNNELGTFKFNSQGNKIIILGKFGNIIIFDLNQLLVKFIFKIIDNSVNPMFANISRNDKYLLTISGGILYLVDIEKYTNVLENHIIDFNIYPNPSQDSIIIQYFLEHSNIVKISIPDLQGIILSNIFSGFKEQGQHNITYSTINIATGHYFITIESNGQVISLPFEIIR
jgi:WD40 repeat protein